MTFAEEWARCAPWIEEALDEGLNAFDLAAVEAMVIGGEAQFWPGERSALVTRVDVYPRARWLLLWLAGGDVHGGGLAEIRDTLVPTAERWGVGQDCTKSVIIGRRGWVKALAADGYAPLAIVTGKALTA